MYKLFSLVLILAFGLTAQDARALQSAPETGVQTAPPTPVPLLILSRPNKDGRAQSYCGSYQAQRPCRLGDTLTVGFDNLHAWMDDSRNRVSTLYLVLNGREMKSLISRGPDSSYSSLQFTLDQVPDPTSESRTTWNMLITELRDDPTLHISVANGGPPPFPQPVDVPFAIFPQWTWAIVLLLLAMLAGFLLLARKSDIVRDAPSIANVKQSYSLARCQMAWWFFITSAAYCYIWATLNNHDSLTTGVLVLTGISAATGLAATVIGGDTGDDGQKLAAELKTLRLRSAALPAAIAAEPADSPLAATLRAEQLQTHARLQQIAQIDASEGFLKDILRDGTGISFHRFQMAGWTVILGLVFIVAVYQHLTMPDFSPTLLGLMGISSGTYIGFKISNASN